MNNKSIFTVVAITFIFLSSITETNGQSQDGIKDGNQIEDIRQGLIEQCRADPICNDQNSDHLGKTRADFPAYDEGTFVTDEIKKRKSSGSVDQDIKETSP